MAHLQYLPGDPRLVDQLVYELKSKGIFDQFRKECIADVDTRPAYQNLRQRVESSVSTFLTRQTWKPDLNKNQLREKLRKHILDGNYLEQGVERIVDQVVNPKVSSVFIPQVEELVYNYLGIPRKKTLKVDTAENSKELLPTDLEAVSPGSVKSNDGEDKENKVQDMDIDSEGKTETMEDMDIDTQKEELVEVSSDNASMDKSCIPLPTEEIKLENIPAPEHSPKPAKIELENIELPKEPTKPVKVELKNIELPREPNLSTDIPLPDEIIPKDNIFKPIALDSEDSNSSSSSSIRRNMSPITPVRNFDDENSCDAQQAFENSSMQEKSDNNLTEPSSFRFNIENNDATDVNKDTDKKHDLSYQFNNQVKINTYNTPMYDDSSNSHNLQIDYESDANTNTSKTADVKQEVENSDDAKKEKKDDKRSSHKSSHRSRDSTRHSSSKDKHSNSRDSSRYDKKSSKDDKSKSSRDKEKSKDGDKRESSKHRSSHKSSSSSKDKHRSSSSSHRISSKSSDDRKSKDSSKDKNSEKDKERSSDKDRSSRDRKDSKSSHRDKDRKSSKKDKDKKKDKKDVDDHYSSSGRGNHSRRSTDRDSNDGSSSSKGSQSQNNSKSTTDSKKESKGSSKSDHTSTSESTSPSDKEHRVNNTNTMQFKPIIRVDKNLETPIANPPRLPFVPDVTLRKPKFANNLAEAKRMMKMRKFLAEEQKKMNQEAALLLEFQANVRPNLSQVYSSIPGPELEFACVTHREDTPDNLNTIKTIDVKIEDIVTFTLENESGDIGTKQVTMDIINDIIGVPVDETVKVEIDTSNTKEDCKENQSTSAIDEISEYVKSTDTSKDPLEESIAEIVDQNMSTEVEITVAETLSEADVSEILEMKEQPRIRELKYFAEHEKFTAELEKHKFEKFLKEYVANINIGNKMYLMNCDTYEENIVKEMAATFGDFEVVNYYKNGHLVPNKILNEVPLSSEISLPLESNEYEERSPLFSPVKSECSFELSSDYDAKLNEIVNKKSRQEVMEIILGGIIDESPTKMPTIDYYTELSDSESNLTIVENVTHDYEGDTEDFDVVTDSCLKRKMDEEISVLTSNKIRKISDSEQISSTTEETEEISNNNKVQSNRSKFLGRAKRVGLPKPKRCTLPNSPSSDKSVENYTQNTLVPTPNGKKIKTPRNKVQRYDTSDLYKPKLHYLSRRNNIT